MLSGTAGFGQKRTILKNEKVVLFLLMNQYMKTVRSSFILLALSTILSGCSPCENETSQTVISPSGKLKAVVFNRNCGATTGFNTQVSIIPGPGSLPYEAGNTLVLDGTVPLKAEWGSDARLNLSGLGVAKVFHQSVSVTGVSINYRN
jgi:ABC-type uncharacterized transport system auxiliary subunit